MTDLGPDSSARELAGRHTDRTISAVELMDLHLARIAERNPELNAIVSLDEERARAGADAADRVPDERARSAARAAVRVQGHPRRRRLADDVRLAALRRPRPRPATTCSSSGSAPPASSPIGKTNVPEFAAGSHTFNTVFGTTRNPVRPEPLRRRIQRREPRARWPAGMVPLADGSDMGGSLRNPASFCGVVGLRPSLGRVPGWPTDNLWETTVDQRPMARTVDDVALLLSVIAGPDPRVPTALQDPGRVFAGPVRGSLVGTRVALSVDLGGAFAVDDEVAAVVEASGAGAGAGRRAS